MASSTKGITKLGPNRWRVRVQGRDKRTGAKIGKMVTVDGTYQAAVRKLAALRVSLESVAKASRVRLRAFASTWLASRVARLKPTTLRKYVNNLDEHILPALGDFYVDAILPSDAQAFVNARIGKLSDYTLVNMVRLLRVISKAVLADRITPTDFMSGVTAPTPKGYTEDAPNLLTAPQLRALLAEIPEQWRALIVLISMTGLRWGEASAIRWEDVIDGEIRIVRGNDRGSVAEVKTERSRRRVPMPPEALGMMKPRKSGLMFPTRRGTMHRGTPLRAVLDKAIKRAGVPRVTTHGLRRTFNNLARQVASREVVKSITGHVTDRMFEHYSQVGPGERSAVQDRVREMVDEPRRPKKKGDDPG